MRQLKNWQVRFMQSDDRGRVSRPVIVDDDGRTVSLRKRRNAVLAAAGPSLLRALEELLDQATLLFHMARCEHPRMSKPATLDQAERLVRSVRFSMSA